MHPSEGKTMPRQLAAALRRREIRLDVDAVLAP
jgi:hypothetical protein